MDTVKTKSIKGTWCDNADGETWNVKMAESQVRSVMQFAKALSDKNLEDLTRNVIMKKLFPSAEMYRAVVDAAEEMAAIMNDKNNASGYHINHATSGKSVYCVYSSEGDNKEYTTDGHEYKKQEEAEAKAAEYEDAYAQEVEEGVWIVWVCDEEESQHIKSIGHYVTQYDTLKEAEKEAKKLENGTVEEEASEEWFAVIGNDQRRRFDILFPSMTRALAFLYKFEMPPAWERYLSVRETCRKEA